MEAQRDVGQREAAAVLPVKDCATAPELAAMAAAVFTKGDVTQQLERPSGGGPAGCAVTSTDIATGM